MSDNSFEKSVGEKLRALPGVFTFHPPDGPVARQWRPGDFIFGTGLRWGVIECKEVRGKTFPLSNWTPQQRSMAARVVDAHGAYWLLVRFEPEGLVRAYQANALPVLNRHLRWDERGSLKPEKGMTLNGQSRSFEVESLIQAT